MATASRFSGELLLRQLPAELAALEKEYGECVKYIKVTDTFRVKTLDLLLHNRAVLDYFAHDLVAFCNRNPGKVYFPIAGKHISRDRFRELMSKKWLPGLDKSRRDIFECIDGLQHYHRGNEWITAFAALANANKHVRLSIMVVNDCKAAVVRMHGKPVLQVGDRGFQEMTIGETGSLSFNGPNGASLTIRGPQTISRDTRELLHVDAGLDLVQRDWREFKFDEFPMQPAPVFLKIVNTEVERIAARLTALLDGESAKPPTGA